MESLMHKIKSFFTYMLILPTLFVCACSTNPATGKRQFTALMSPAQENSVGAQEHQKIVQQYGLVTDKKLNDYVTALGKRVTEDTERPDVQYKFYIIDSPIVNAFALPGGYIYVSRGLLALSNSEAELASVLGHEAGHITGRHSAERYSRGVVTSLGAGILSAAIGSQGASQAISLGSNLYLSSYSRDQENEADTLGLRYMTRGGFAPQAVPSFLYSLQRQSDLDARLSGQQGNRYNYFSTHPATDQRVAKTKAESMQYPQTGINNRDAHLKAINGMTYGDSERQGFARDNNFYHPELGLKFSVPQNFTIKNQPSQVIALDNKGSLIVFDMMGNKEGYAPLDYIRSVWMKETQLQNLEEINVNGMKAATASFPGQINGENVVIRVVAISWKDRFARFQLAIPRGAKAALVEDIKKTTYSFRNMSANEKKTIKPYSVKIIAAGVNDTVKTLAARMPFKEMAEERFRVMNAMAKGTEVQSGALYKIVSE